MGLESIIGKPIADFLTNRESGLLDNIAWMIILSLFSFIYKRFSKSTFLARYSLWARLISAILIIGVFVVFGFIFKANSTALLVFVFVGFGLASWWVLKDISKVGITNAFETTKQGISAEASLKEVTKELTFLGVGAKKLTESREFDAMLKRCKNAGGSVKFLLSHPENTALENLATQNGRDNFSYRSRVKESIREIHTRATRIGVPCEIRLYDLQQKIALPHFRLMFIDKRLCIFSQVVWNSNEGLDNPQLILCPNKNNAHSSLYQGYYEYFNDLWDLNTTKKVDGVLLDKWQV
ncbi:hypothetical protein [Acetobacter thailandicus]|uniref:hypothetical protein n=1 Tax=Acetobacter thailandicus TaxID=1502842 RepID=UPI001BAD4C22|nr:hypothetical protein [Acetobacter thailandicus]MBS1004368.1 hypothetical protein [Acetobacter thailandicus]